MKVGYARVSTVAQDTRRQDAALAEAGCERIFIDKWTGDSHIRGREGGRQMDSILRAGDRVVCTEIGRAGRKPAALLAWLDELDHRGVEVEFLNEGLVFIPGTPNAVAHLIVGIMASIASMERSILLMRAEQGRKEAMKAGVRFGRPEKLDEAQKRALARAHNAAVNDGQSATAAARETGRVFGVSPRTVFRIVAAEREKVAA